MTDVEKIAAGIAATMNEGDSVVASGDHFSGGIFIRSATDEDRPIAYGLQRPMLDTFAQMIRDARATRERRSRGPCV